MPSNLERKARRKRQTRLTFDPVDRSSSPANMSPAKVRHELPGKRQRQTPASSFTGFTNDSENGDVLSSVKKGDFSIESSAPAKKNQKSPFKPLPTPAKSSQPQAKVDTSIDSIEDLEDESDSDIPRTARQTRSSSNFIRSVDSSKRKHRRAGTGFDGSYSSSDGSEPEVETITPSKKLKKTPTKAKKAPTKPKPIVISESEESELVMALPTRSTRSSAKSRRQKSVTLSDTSEDEIAMSGLRSSQRKTSPRNGKNAQNSPRAPTASQKRGKKTAVNSESNEDDIRSSSQKRRLSHLTIPDDEDEDDDEEDVKPPSARKRPQKAAVDTDDEESQPIISPLKRTRQPVESDDSDIVSSPLKRRRGAQQVDEDSSDSNLPSPSNIPRNAERDSASKTPPRFTRQQKTVRRHRTEKEKKMELLKRRRAGENVEQVTDSESDSAEDNADEELQELSEFEDEEESPEQVRNPSKGKTQKKGSDSEDDFVVEDDEGPLGIPDHLAQVPLEYTHAAHKPIKEHFRDVVEWMVHNKVNPGFVWDDPVYRTAFQKVDSECNSFADSKFVSTQWTAEFTKAIYARPVLLIRDLLPGEGIDVLGEAKCEACNHRKHNPSFALQFTGKAYHKNTLEEVDQESTDEDSDDDDEDSQYNDHVSVDENHRTLPSEDKQWFAGSVCKFNAEQAHILIHWKWHLNDWIVSRLEEEGLCTPKKLAERDKMKSKQRYKYANNIVDRWEAEGIIKTLYKDFKSQKDTARELQTRARGGWK